MFFDFKPIFPVGVSPFLYVEETIISLGCKEAVYKSPAYSQSEIGDVLPELIFNSESFPSCQRHEEGSTSGSHFLLQNIEDQILKFDVMRRTDHRGTHLPGPLLSRAQVDHLQRIRGKRHLRLLSVPSSSVSRSEGEPALLHEEFWCHYTRRFSFRARFPGLCPADSFLLKRNEECLSLTSSFVQCGNHNGNSKLTLLPCALSYQILRITSWGR